MGGISWQHGAVDETVVRAAAGPPTLACGRPGLEVVGVRAARTLMPACTGGVPLVCQIPNKQGAPPAPACPPGRRLGHGRRLGLVLGRLGRGPSLGGGWQCAAGRRRLIGAHQDDARGTSRGGGRVGCPSTSRASRRGAGRRGGGRGIRLGTVIGHLLCGFKVLQVGVARLQAHGVICGRQGVVRK